MYRAILTVVIAVALSAGISFEIVSKSGPATSDLAADILSVKAKISAAEADAQKYSGGTILMETELQISILKSTLAMLDQKQTSFLRGITLNYLDPLPHLVSEVEQASDASDLAKARAEASVAREEADRYSGGLLRSLALVREATARAVEASIEQRIALAKIGMPLPSLAEVVPTAEHSPGKTAADKDALQ